MTYPHTLRFPPSNLPVFTENEPVSLPPIQPYLPAKTDQDNAEALFALYRTHCTSLIDSIRFCKEKQFFRLYTSFHGTLTVPVQKLFTHPNLAPWIEQCDLATYRTMIRFVSRLTLQAAPVVVINILSNISANLHAHIAKTFSSQPLHVLEAKLRPATVFASLLYRLIRVNQSAHAAANLLTIDQNREQMWREWSTMVNPKRVMEAELPSCGYEEVYKVLTTEMRSLLEPLQAPQYADDPYGFQAYNFEENGSFAAFLQHHNGGGPPGSRNGTSSAVSTENVLDRWSTFITSLPTRFPHAPARTLLHCISAVGTAALRDITIMNGASYGHWWVLKIFVDEMALWMAEMGGFLEPEVLPIMVPNSGGSAFQSPVLEEGGSRSHSGSRGVSIGAPETNAAVDGQWMGDFGQRTVPIHHQRESALVFPPEKHMEDIDDSGIGLSLGEV
jgi:regulatory factor X